MIRAGSSILFCCCLVGMVPVRAGVVLCIKGSGGISLQAQDHCCHEPHHAPCHTYASAPALSASPCCVDVPLDGRYDLSRTHGPAQTLACHDARPTAEACVGLDQPMPVPGFGRAHSPPAHSTVLLV